MATKWAAFARILWHGLHAARSLFRHLVRMCSMSKTLRAVAALALVALIAGGAAAQAERGAARITLAQANTIVAKALERAREQGFAPLSVVVLDDSGDLKAMQREDGASMFRFDVALGKAWASVAMGASSRALAQRAQDNPNFFITLAATAEGKFLPQPGGVLIRNAAGEILGAAGASGASGDQDEAAVAYGIEQAGLVADPPSR
jgi:uncharacterized protein GlcG (DUF336 family)